MCRRQESSDYTTEESKTDAPALVIYGCGAQKSPVRDKVDSADNEIFSPFL
jgi:hypothetical protein